ncbi:MAG: hypothetical protein AAGF13_00010 [Pseudomonadota bacterium]
MKLLLLGSGPSATIARNWPRAPFDRIVAINNAWQIRDDWDDLIYPFDFPDARKPQSVRPNQRLIDETHFVDAQNAYGGFAYGGATMAFTATYWALHALKPTMIAYLGCDMVYPKSGPTHFYGTGTADPLRNDFSLRSLEAKSARAQCYAAAQGCTLVNLSTDESRLDIPRAGRTTPPAELTIDTLLMARAEAAEEVLGYRTPTGFHSHITPDLAAYDAIDTLWLAAGGASTQAQREPLLKRSA